MNRKEHHKIVLLGASGVGKSSITLRYIRNVFFEYSESTIGAAFLSTTVSHNDKLFSLDIWDTAGQERYSSLAPMYYRGSSAAIIVYDITSADSFKQAKRWIREVKSNIDDCYIILVGNKLDIEFMRDVPLDIAKQYSKDNLIDFIETSAKSSIGISNIFQNIVDKLPDKTRNCSSIDMTTDTKSINKSCKC